jgi:hypothetical protein
MIGYRAPLSTPRPSAHRPGLVAMARTAGIAGGVLALAGAAVSCTSATSCTAVGEPTPAEARP